MQEPGVAFHAQGQRDHRISVRRKGGQMPGEGLDRSRHAARSSPQAARDLGARLTGELRDVDFGERRELEFIADTERQRRGDHDRDRRGGNPGGEHRQELASLRAGGVQVVDQG